MVTYAWRGDLADTEVERLHAEGFGHSVTDFGWWAQLTAHSLGWVCARDDGTLVGFVNVAWDGAGHAFILDTLVADGHRRRGIGTRLVVLAIEHARTAGCKWLHVDYDAHLRGFYEESCRFTRTNAGLVAL